MRLEYSLRHVASFTPESFSDIRRNIDPEWIEQALQATGTATLRRRRLPAVQVIWLVIGMALFRKRPIFDVVDKLDLALPGKALVAKSAIPRARARVGAEPLEWLFTRCAEAWAHASAASDRWRGLALYGVDGSALRVADSPENRDHFGGHTGARGDSGYPLLRLVALMALRSHLLASAAFGPYESAELTYANELWSSVPDESLTILDRGFWSANVLLPLARDGKDRHWLIRAKKTTNGRRIKRLGPGDEIFELEVSPQARQQDASLPKTWLVRIIHYQRKGFQPQRLLTSLLDAKRFPGNELVALYHERWELELAYDEIKTEMLEREESLRSKSPNAVTQELWGVLIAYNLVRLEMERVADEAGVPPTRISFVGALRLIVDEWMWTSDRSPGAIPRHLQDLRANLKRLVLPTRSGRTNPRVVKIKMSNYPRKRSPTGNGLK
jgi:hypothetical protein